MNYEQENLLLKYDQLIEEILMLKEFQLNIGEVNQTTNTLMIQK
jgi:hypothetical protein